VSRLYCDRSDATRNAPVLLKLVDPGSNGMVHGLRPGKAKITGDFDGVQDSIVVSVYTRENAPVGYRRVQ